MLANFIYQNLLICQFELKRLFATRKGWLYLATYLVVWYFILFYPIRYAANLLDEHRSTAHAGSFFEFLGFGSLLDWSIPAFGVYWHFALIFFPMMSVVIAADQTCSDRVRGTLRFLALRVSRDGLFFGRYISFMVIQFLLILLTLLATLLLVVFRDSSLLLEAFNNAASILINLFLVLLPFTAMMAGLSATVKSARQATVWAVLIWSFLAGIISALSSYLPILGKLKILIPGYQLSGLAQLSEWETLQLAYIPVLQAVILLIIGRWIMQRQAL